MMDATITIPYGRARETLDLFRKLGVGTYRGETDGKTTTYKVAGLDISALVLLALGGKTMNEDTAIVLSATHAGYRVVVNGEWIGSLLLRIYEGDRRVEDGTVLATPAANDVPSQRFSTIGTALDYLLSCPVGEAQ